MPIIETFPLVFPWPYSASRSVPALSNLAAEFFNPLAVMLWAALVIVLKVISVVVIHGMSPSQYSATLRLGVPPAAIDASSPSGETVQSSGITPTSVRLYPDLTSTRTPSSPNARAPSPPSQLPDPPTPAADSHIAPPAPSPGASVLGSP